MDLLNGPSWAGWNGLPPTPGSLHLGCSYNLHSSHHFLSTWGAVMFGKKKKSCHNGLLLKHGYVYCWLVRFTIMFVSTTTIRIRLCSIKSSLPSLYPLHHSRDKLIQALSRFPVLHVTKSWARPGNEATVTYCHTVTKDQLSHLLMLYVCEAHYSRVYTL